MRYRVLGERGYLSCPTRQPRDRLHRNTWRSKRINPSEPHIRQTTSRSATKLARGNGRWHCAHILSKSRRQLSEEQKKHGPWHRTSQLSLNTSRKWPVQCLCYLRASESDIRCPRSYYLFCSGNRKRSVRRSFQCTSLPRVHRLGHQARAEDYWYRHRKNNTYSISSSRDYRPANSIFSTRASFWSRDYFTYAHG
jgi:hypothetical protein